MKTRRHDKSSRSVLTLADAPPRIQKTPPWLMKLLLLVLVSCSRQYRQMLSLLYQNLREWRESTHLQRAARRAVYANLACASPGRAIPSTKFAMAASRR